VTVDLAGADITLPKLIVASGLAASASDAARKIQQGGVKLERQKVGDVTLRVPAGPEAVVLEVGRRAVRVKLRGAPGAPGTPRTPGTPGTGG
jgi:tyrosyl-tRNA synthetase